jgi:hypothetical protein
VRTLFEDRLDWTQWVSSKEVLTITKYVDVPAEGLNQESVEGQNFLKHGLFGSFGALL